MCSSGTANQESSTPRSTEGHSAPPSVLSSGSESCIPYFDTLWFCYSPVHQMEHYYRYGLFDDCRGRWADFMGCVARKTKLGEQTAPEPDACYWEQRSPAEAARFWASEFPKQ